MKKFGIYFPRIALSIILLAVPLIAADYDIAIIGGRVIDPETGLNEIRNVGIKDGRITAVTSENISAPKIIDARNRIVSPGFIDLHAHGQTIPAARMQAMDGVTTALELEAGMLPISDYYDEAAKEGRPINYGASVNWANARIATFLNIKPDHALDWFFASFKNPVWQTSISSDTQLAKISKMVEHELDQGGLGIGFLLGYAPGTGRKEYFEISSIAAARNLPTFTHARFLSMLEPNSSFEGMAEIISVAAGTGGQVHIVHLNSMSLRDIDAIGTMILNAQRQGLRISTEAYPYGAGSTGIGAAMFQGPNWRERTGGMTAGNFDVGGKRLTEEEFADLQKNHPETETIIHFLDTSKPEDQATLDKSILFPGGVIASDGGTWSVGQTRVAKDVFPIPANAWSHPRSAGTFARFLGHYVRETKAISLIDAIEKVSFGPAKILQDSVPQMKKKGRIQVGADADIVVFDLATVSDRATYAKPAQTSIGFDYVIVGGAALVEKGILNTKVMPGKPVRNKIVK
ncbi:MAG: amidohydrolase family protein [Acidobacteria bacterium]|nr:amidohydrolase family protein [Acidobacteriota bacterium]